MRLIYLDESGDDGVNGSKVYVLAGVAIKDSELSTTQKYLRGIVEQNLHIWKEIHVQDMYFKSEFRDKNVKLPKEIDIITRPELHYADLIKGKKPYDKLNKLERKKMADDVFVVLKNPDIKLFGVVIRKKEHFYKYHAPKPADLFAIEMLMERCETYLRLVNDQGIIICDNKDRQTNKITQNFFDFLRRDGTKFVKIDHIIENLMFVPSHLSELVQLADFCSHTLFMKFEFGKDRRYQAIRKCFFSIKVWPDANDQ